MAYTGVTASLAIGDKTIAYISNFSIEETRDMVEIGRFGNACKEKMPALYAWSASADGTADFATESGQTLLRDAMVNGAKLEAKFYLDTVRGVYLHGYAYVESFSVDVSAEDRANVSIGLSGTDTLTLVTPAS